MYTYGCMQLNSATVASVDEGGFLSDESSRDTFAPVCPTYNEPAQTREF